MESHPNRNSLITCNQNEEIQETFLPLDINCSSYLLSSLLSGGILTHTVMSRSNFTMKELKPFAVIQMPEPDGSYSGITCRVLNGQMWLLEIERWGLFSLPEYVGISMSFKVCRDKDLYLGLLIAIKEQKVLGSR